MPAPPPHYSLATDAVRKAAYRLEFMKAALAGACSANNGSVALYTAAQAAAYALASADQVIALLAAEG